MYSGHAPTLGAGKCGYPGILNLNERGPAGEEMLRNISKIIDY